MSQSSNSELDRIIKAVQSPRWSVGTGIAGTIMATHDSGQIGMPYVVTATRGGRGYRVSLYMPGDDVTVEGEHIGEISGNPREMGRQLREILENVELPD